MQQSIKHANGPIQAKLTLPGSKSMTYRAILLAALADGVSEISGIRITEAVRTFINAIHQLGIVTQLDEKAHSCIVAGGNGKFPKKQATVWCANTKIVARFLLAACAPTPGVFYFDGAPLLRKKYMSHVLNILTQQGAQLIPNDARHLPFTLIGSDSLLGGEVNLDEHINSQILSAMLMIAPFARSPFSFNVPDLANQPNINMTCALMGEFGVLVHRYHQGQFTVPVPQRYQAKDVHIEPDFSVAAYFFAANTLIGGELTIQATKASTSKQLDAKFLTVLEQMGSHAYEHNIGLTIKSSGHFEGIEISLRHFSDTFFALIAIAPFANTATRISHIGTLSKKEQDRLMATKIELTKLDIRIEVGDNWVKIFPSTPKGCVLNSHHDAHLAMALAVIGLKVPGVIIENASCVNKIFPGFFQLLEKMTNNSSISA